MTGRTIHRIVVAFVTATVACGDSGPAPTGPVAIEQRAAGRAHPVHEEHAQDTAPKGARPAPEQHAAADRHSPADDAQSHHEGPDREPPPADAHHGDTHPAEHHPDEPPAGSHGGEHAAEHRPHEHGHGAGQPVGRRFRDAESWAGHFDNPRRNAWQKPRHVVAIMDIEPGMTVVDIGAGTGYFLPHLSAAVGPEGRVLGLDIEPDMVRYMTERATRQGLDNVEAREVSPADPGLAPASVDRVLVVNTWHHIADRAAYAAKLARALKPGGAVYIVDYTLTAKRGPRRSHRLAAAQVLADLEAGGLAAERVKEKLPHQYITVGRPR